MAYPYERYTKGPDPMSEWGHAMFAMPGESSHYGPICWGIKPGVRLTPIRDPKIKAAVLKVADMVGLPGHYEDADDLLKELDPRDIVNHAGLWDDPEGFQWLWDNVLDPLDVRGLETQDGAIVFDRTWIVKKEPLQEKVASRFLLG